MYVPSLPSLRYYSHIKCDFTETLIDYLNEIHSMLESSKKAAKHGNRIPLIDKAELHIESMHKFVRFVELSRETCESCGNRSMLGFYPIELPEEYRQLRIDATPARTAYTAKADERRAEQERRQLLQQENERVLAGLSGKERVNKW